MAQRDPALCEVLSSHGLSHIAPLLPVHTTLATLQTSSHTSLGAQLKTSVPAVRLGDRLRFVNAVRQSVNLGGAAAEESPSQRHQPTGLSERLAALACAGSSRSTQQSTSMASLAEVVDRKAAVRAAPARFQFAPSSVRWEHELAALECGAVNTLGWHGSSTLPTPPSDLAGRLWLLPCTEEVAEAIARHRDELRALGWRVLAADSVALVATLGNKVALRTHAEELGLQAHLPTAYPSLDEADYPAILKAGDGTAGEAVFIVDSEGAALAKLGRAGPASLGRLWTLQELVYGRVEHSVSLLVVDGAILRVVHTTYVYASDAYVWPRAREVRRRRRTDADVPAEHLAVLASLLSGYSGICNVNYKVRDESPREDGGATGCGPDGRTPGQMAIFEVNPRVGGDLATDAARDQVRDLLETLDRTCA